MFSKFGSVLGGIGRIENEEKSVLKFTLLKGENYKFFSLQCFISFLVVLILTPVTLYAQELVAKTTSNRFIESFDAASPVSGIPLAGLIIGKDEGRVDINHVNIVAPLVADRITCIIARTRDGRYYSENSYHVPVATQNIKIAKLDPATKRYKKKLAGYQANNYALVGRLVIGNNCETAAELYLPRVADPKSSKLFLYINSGSGSSHVTATLLSNGGEEEKAKRMENRTFHCQMLADDANIAFDTECVLDIIPFMGKTSEIEVKLDDGIEPESYHYKVLIPALSSAGL